MTITCDKCGTSVYLAYMPPGLSAKFTCPCGIEHVSEPDTCPDCTHQPCEGCERELGGGDA
jgi:hypothetical protein